MYFLWSDGIFADDNDMQFWIDDPPGGKTSDAGVWMKNDQGDIRHCIFSGTFEECGRYIGLLGTMLEVTDLDGIGATARRYRE